MEKIDIKKSSALLNKGKVVAFPTETVYGLGADACNPNAVCKVFEIKKRPKKNPLIIHINSYFKVKYWAKNLPIVAYKIAINLWPGPITILLKKKKYRKTNNSQFSLCSLKDS